MMFVGLVFLVPFFFVYSFTRAYWLNKLQFEGLKLIALTCCIFSSSSFILCEFQQMKAGNRENEQQRNTQTENVPFSRKEKVEKHVIVSTH